MGASEKLYSQNASDPTEHSRPTAQPHIRSINFDSETRVTDNRVLAGKVAIVTGARRGIGAAEAVALAAAGSTVVICDLVYEDLLTVKARIEDAGGTCMAVKCDVSQKAQVTQVVDETISAYGRVDVLVNNAQGAMDPTSWADISDDMLMTSLMTGPVASYWFMQACFPHMKTQGRGRIINTASAAARGGIANLGHYAMAKGAIASLTYAAATDWGEFGITANVIFPGIESESLTAISSGQAGTARALRSEYSAQALWESIDRSGAGRRLHRQRRLSVPDRSPVLHRRRCCTRSSLKRFHSHGNVRFLKLHSVLLHSASAAFILCQRRKDAARGHDSGDRGFKPGG